MTNPFFSATCLLEAYAYKPHGVILMPKAATMLGCFVKKSPTKAPLLRILRGLEKDLEKKTTIAILNSQPEKFSKLITLVKYMKNQKENKLCKGIMGVIRKILSILQNIITFQGCRTSIGIANDVIEKLQKMTPPKEVVKEAISSFSKPIVDPNNPKITRFEGTNITITELD